MLVLQRHAPAFVIACLACAHASASAQTKGLADDPKVAEAMEVMRVWLEA
jgi:hypothetical protein